MTESQGKSDAIVRRMVRLWPVIVVAAIVGALLMAWTAYSNAPDFSYTGAAAVRVANHVASPAYPSVDSAVAIAVQPSLRDEAIRKAGVDPANVGAVAAAVDPKDATVVQVTVTGSDAKTAQAVAAELRSLVVSQTLEAVSSQIAYYRGVESAYLDTQQNLQDVAKTAQERLQSDPNNTDLLTLYVTATGQARAAAESARNAKLQGDLWEGGVSAFGDPSATAIDKRRPVFVAAVQGAVLGAIIGFLLVAGVAAYQARGVSGAFPATPPPADESGQGPPAE